jgi:predicted metal-dependent enzyme (double-stranded beta helix superfamily)
MPYTLENFCDDCRATYDPATGNADLEEVRVHLESLLENQEFLQEHCGPDAEIGAHTLYTDDERGFIVLAHIMENGRTSPPHDHGASWAIYGQATKFTDMTEYDRQDDGSEQDKAKVEKTRKYRLEPGMAGIFGAHEIHSIHFPDNARFIRVTGSDLSTIETLAYNMDEGSVKVIPPSADGLGAGQASAD